MSQEIQSKIWEVGFSTKSQENWKPRGLGMWNVKSILKEHGGNIRIVSSEIWYGTTFEITLPWIKTPEVINDATETSNVAKRKARILLVDDEETILDSGSQSLLHRGHSVDSAQWGKWALELLEKEEYDIIITDFNMPDMNGIELVQKIQERWITTPIIITTGNVRFSSPFLDNVFVLYKPCEPSDIEARIQIVMDEKDKQGEL
jgi:CheY-like chemotaxis protein